MSTTHATAGNWTVVPRVIGSETYTDNVTAAHSNAQSDFITEISPGINISGDSGRSKLNLDYQLQSLFFAGDSGRNSTNQNLAAIGQTELIKDLFFVDGNASISQQIVDAQKKVSLDNFTAGGNRTDVRTYSISPNLRHDFSGYANGTLRYTHEIVDYGNTTVVDNSEANSVQAALASGRHSGPLGWDINYNDKRTQRTNSINDVTYKNMDGEMRYLLTPKLSAVVQGGREENQYVSLQPIVNGNYWAAGLDWMPNRYIKMRGLDGDHYKTAGVTLTPNVRTELVTTYRNREVGLNPGPAWSGSLTHRTINTVLEAGYTVDTVTEQQLAQERLMLVGKLINRNTGEIIDYVYQDPNGNVLLEPSPDLSGISTLTNEVIARKRATAAVNYHLHKSAWRFDVFDEQRVFQASQLEERGRGAHVSWGLQLSPRSQTLVTVGTQRSRFSGSQQNDFYFIQAGLSHQYSRSVSGGIDYRYFNQNSNGTSNDYQENRLTARIIVRF